MKHSRDAIADLLGTLAEGAGIELTPEQERLLVQDVLAVIDANERVNLTSIRDPAEAVRLHVIDSLVAGPELDEELLAGAP